MTYKSERAVLRRGWQWVVFALALAFLFVVPLFAGSYWLVWLTTVEIVIVAVLGLHILTGLCGQVSIGQAAFIGVGAYTVAVLTTKCGLNPWLCLPISILAAGAIGLVFGLPCFRLKGFYLAVSTMAASAMLVWCFQHFQGTTGGFAGMDVQRLTLGGIDFSNRSSFFILATVLMIAATLFAMNIQRTATGRAFVAIRDSELSAEVNGIPIFRQKMLAFFIGCMYAGLAGWLWAFSKMRINPDQFRLLDSMFYLGMLVIGGWGSMAGVFLGVLFLKLLEVLLIDHVTPVLADAFPALATQIQVSTGLIVNGLVVIIFMMLERRGLIQLYARLRDFCKRRWQEYSKRLRPQRAR
jgi:branched-chain amino acid transport system permease protein